MSKHHVNQQWSTHSPKLRAKILPLLPLPCIQCGRPVTKDQTWHVGHRLGAASGGKPTPQNVGPAHAKCNLRDGGRVGARITNARRNASRIREKDIRSWL